MTNYEAARALFKRTRDEHFAVGAFNVDNQETLRAIAAAAVAQKSPVLIEVSQGEVDAMGLANIRCMVDNYVEELGIEMYINLDHSPSLEAAKAGIDAGFEFIHIDVSKDTTVEENIAITRQVVEYAKTTGALVEAEMEYFSGSSNVHTEDISEQEIKSHFTKPEEAKKFVEATGIDTFAASIGNLHGLYPTPKHLDIELLKQIRATLDCFISLHGGSGTPDDMFRDAVAAGVSKVNLNSEMRKAFRAGLERELAVNPTEYAVVKLMPSVIADVQRIVENRMQIFGSASKAS